MLSPQFLLPIAAKLVIDLFAGGGGASTGIEQAIGRHVDVAVNHDADAIGMHEVNHPQTRHYRADVREVDPLAVTRGQLVGLLHASPDCTHHSQALGGQPRSEEIRSLAWVVHRWAGKTKPDVITLENVEQMLQWSPLVAKRCPDTGRVITLDRVTDAAGKTVFRVADPGEVVPRRNQFLVPDKKRQARNWRHFVEGLRAMGYKVEWRVICNADLGAHSTRTRLYMVARCDGLREGVSTVTTSGSQQQLAAAHLVTLRRNSVGRGMDEPVPTLTAGAEHHALVQYQLSPEHEAGALQCAAFLMRYHGNGGQWADLRDSMTTITTHDRLALVTVWLKGEPWVIVDITLRMLVPRELYNAQDFPATYVIDRTAAGKPLTKTAQVRMAGNSVSPLPMSLIVAANYSDVGMAQDRRAA
ncbi:DNA cytosine methyltransferase [Acidovorax sp. NCPPB 4044]|uniref:DNA cytosine methyltransferase n=1 Tax=Acidovorax sp. NCPPB 4044 TaxID=2940490 RepID=UPI0023045953|nr:DNA cytosine methyltransferase [Acidovorax sp. NCPPB 4044]MDA8522019.1 DNA cytosine methyltransferase [Acidovorax sp. NCPPB 4044]